MNRLVPAFAIPVGVAIVVFLIVFGYSRELLALATVDAMLSTTAAMLAALVVLGCVPYWLTALGEAVPRFGENAPHPGTEQPRRRP